MSIIIIIIINLLGALARQTRTNFMFVWLRLCGPHHMADIPNVLYLLLPLKFLT